MAKVVREKLGRPVQLIKDIVSSDVKATCADPAPGSAILLENSHFYAEEEGTGKDTDDNKIRADPEKAKDSAIPLPRWLTSTAVMPLRMLPEVPSLLLGKCISIVSLVLSRPQIKLDEKLILSFALEVAGVSGSPMIAVPKLDAKQFRLPLLAICQGK